jgi:hypothetical protein
MNAAWRVTACVPCSVTTKASRAEEGSQPRAPAPPSCAPNTAVAAATAAFKASTSTRSARTASASALRPSLVRPDSEDGTSETGRWDREKGNKTTPHASKTREEWGVGGWVGGWVGGMDRVQRGTRVCVRMGACE